MFVLHIADIMKEGEQAVNINSERTFRRKTDSRKGRLLQNHGGGKGSDFAKATPDKLPPFSLRHLALLEGRNPLRPLLQGGRRSLRGREFYNSLRGLGLPKLHLRNRSSHSECWSS